MKRSNYKVYDAIIIQKKSALSFKFGRLKNLCIVRLEFL